MEASYANNDLKEGNNGSNGTEAERGLDTRCATGEHGWGGRTRWRGDVVRPCDGTSASWCSWRWAGSHTGNSDGGVDNSWDAGADGHGGELDCWRRGSTTNDDSARSGSNPGGWCTAVAVGWCRAGDDWIGRG